MWVIYLAGAGPFGYCRGQYPEGWLVCAVLDVLVPGFPQVCQPVNQPIIPWVASWRAKHGSCGTCRDSRKGRNGPGLCMLCAARKAAEGRGRPRKAAEGRGTRGA